VTDPALPCDAVAYLVVVSRGGPPVLLRIPVAGAGYAPKWTALVRAARQILVEHGQLSEFLMLDRVVGPWDWLKPWGGKLLIADLRERARRADAAFAGAPEAYPRHYLYDWTGKAFTRVRGPIEAPAPPVAEEPAP
jgi:hypothetical protein